MIFFFKDFEIRMIFIFFAIYFFPNNFVLILKNSILFIFAIFFVLYFKIKDFFFLILLYWILFNPKKIGRGKKIIIEFFF